MTDRRSDEDRGRPSPFRSRNELTRYRAALDMIEKRRSEAWDLERALYRTRDKQEQARLTLRLLATRNNLKSWQRYAESCPREKRAVIRP